MHRQPFRSARLGLALVGGVALVLSSRDTYAQVAGSAGRPLPNVLLLVDNSGSMERKPDNQPPTCKPGDGTSEINRWGMLLQALTGSFQPYFSCAAVPRTSGSDFVKRYSIAGKEPYDVDYFLPYHQPMTGSTEADACVMSPWKLPGTTAGVGSAQVSHGSGIATDYPDDAIVAYKFKQLGTGLPASLIDTNKCTFDQSNDGQLDVSKAYARFALMTFDSLTDGETGATGSYGAQQIDGANPFKGQWSYHRDATNEFFSSCSPFTNPGCNDSIIGAMGAPGTTPACSPTPQEVGARNAAAPPWEGRLIGFADPDATLYDLDAQNAQIQQTLLATRPYGATPIDGLMDDARNYLFHDQHGPKDDPYKCRDKYIILLTDGAPNLDLRPSCTAANGVCPYPRTAGDIADQMFNHASDDKKVTTFVIGFSVNGVDTAASNDGFPSEYDNSTPAKGRNCKAWFDGAAASATNDYDAAKAMQDVCYAPLTKPPPGTTGDACCKLNDVALLGSGMGAFFAESQADIVLAFGRIMANIIHSASTKTIPAFAPATQFSSAAFAAEGGTTASSAQFIASYIPSSQTPWAGELDRTRFLCKADSGPLASTAQPPDPNLGDFQSENLAVQTNHNKRVILSVLADKVSDDIDSSATIRPFVGTGDGIGAPGSGATTYEGKEVVMKNYDLLHSETDWPTALGINDKTCRRGRAVKKGVGAGRGTAIVPALTDPKECTDVVWGFATAYPNKLSFAGYDDFNVRCNGDTATEGTCSITPKDCSPQTGGCPTGETCIPKCAAMGAVYHSTPAISPAPSGLLREEGFRNYQAKYAKRRTVMYAATTDGLLHAFDAMLQHKADDSNLHELWAFAPPAVLPNLASNYPGGNQVLLDGAPVVKEVVWDRKMDQLGSAAKWHTTLVAGLGTLGGYYALNVTDADCSDGLGTDTCYTKYQSPSKGLPGDVGLPDAAGNDTTPKPGPHFLWQLTDIPAESTEPGKIVRESTLGTPKAKMTALFGRNTSTPAIGMVQIKNGSVERQIGVAILPGGYDDPPVKGGECIRMAKAVGTVDISDTTNGSIRSNVRQWAKGGCGAPVPGRNLTIVRLDTGEVIRVFGRKQDTPQRLQDKLPGGGLLETAFDSPIVGTPVVYPDQPGVPIQKIFVGDADGTLWRIDVRSTDPSDWKAYLFADLIGNASSANAAASQPIQVPPVLSTDDAGNVIVNVATGDQESIVANDSLENFVYSIRESLNGPKAEILWYKRLNNAERVTGPMTVFDKTLYFATYQPIRPTDSSSASCDSPGKASLWGMHYTDVKESIASANGGLDRWCKVVDAAGVCTGNNYVDKEEQGKDLIPGVALTASQACVTDGATDEYGNTAFSQITQAQYSLSFGIARPNDAGHKAQAARSSVQRQLPRMATKISSWSLVLE